jgi:hypothetical protein
MRILLALALLPTFACAQRDTGSVSGHIYCADTQRPARGARVVLVPLPPPGASIPRPKQGTSPPNSANTRMDGSFSLPHVPPGDYYISVTYSGYLSPEYKFSEDQLLSPSQEIRKQIVESVPTVSVAAGKAFTVSTTIRRGGAISGVVRYDDGSPVPDIAVVPIVRGPDGQWNDIRKSSSDDRLFSVFGAGTDDLGRFRISELPSGEYSLVIGRYGPDQSALAIYYGDGFLKKDAKAIKLGDGEDSSGDDITIRLSKLHTVAGAFINISGQPITSGKISLLTDPDGIQIAGATVEAGSDSPSFRMDLVPEGHYTVRVTEAQDVLDQTVPGENPGDLPGVKETVLQTYGDYQAPLEVIGDIPSLILTIPPKSPAKAPAPTSN